MVGSRIAVDGLLVLKRPRPFEGPPRAAHPSAYGGAPRPRVSSPTHLQGRCQGASAADEAEALAGVSRRGSQCNNGGRADSGSRGDGDGGGGAENPNAWREAVGSPEIADAWERLAAAVVQEFVYDSFWSYVSPDTELPSEVRRLLHSVFGAAAARARAARVDWGALLLR